MDDLRLLPVSSWVRHQRARVLLWLAFLGALRAYLARARRGAALPDGVGVVVQDEIETLDHNRDTQVRWAMMTAAEVEITAPDAATLCQDGQHLTLRVLEPTGAQLEVYATEPPPDEHDQPNPGTRMVGFTVHLPPTSEHRLVVLLAPGTREGPAPAVKPLEQW